MPEWVGSQAPLLPARLGSLCRASCLCLSRLCRPAWVRTHAPTLARTHARTHALLPRCCCRRRRRRLTFWKVARSASLSGVPLPPLSPPTLSSPPRCDRLLRRTFATLSLVPSLFPPSPPPAATPCATTSTSLPEGWLVSSPVRSASPPSPHPGARPSHISSPQVTLLRVSTESFTERRPPSATATPTLPRPLCHESLPLLETAH